MEIYMDVKVTQKPNVTSFEQMKKIIDEEDFSYISFENAIYSINISFDGVNLEWEIYDFESDLIDNSNGSTESLMEDIKFYFPELNQETILDINIEQGLGK